MTHPSSRSPFPVEPRAEALTAIPPTIINLQELPPTLTVEQAAVMLGCGRTLAYQLIRRDEFPCTVLRLGNRRYVIPTAELLRALGLTVEGSSAPEIPA